MSIQGKVHFHDCNKCLCDSRDGHDRADSHISLNRINCMYIDITHADQDIRAAVFESTSCMTHIQHSAYMRLIHH